MARQDKGPICACGCGEKKTMRKLRFFPGHNPQTQKLRAKRDARASDYLEQRKLENDSRLLRLSACAPARC